MYSCPNGIPFHPTLMPALRRVMPVISCGTGVLWLRLVLVSVDFEHYDLKFAFPAAIS